MTELEQAALAAAAAEDAWLAHVKAWPVADDMPREARVTGRALWGRRDEAVHRVLQLGRAIARRAAA